MKKRIALIALTLAIAVSTFTGCGKNNNTAESTPTPEITATPSPEVAENTATPDENASAETEAPDASEQTSEPSSKPAVETPAKPNVQTPATQAPEVQAPVSTPTQVPTPAPTQAPTPTPAPVPTPSVSELMGKMVGALDKDSHNLSEMPKELYDTVYQINPSDYDDVLIYGSMMNVNANEIIVIKATNQANVDKAKNALSRRLSALDNQWKHYLPSQYELVQAGKITVKGLYVSLVIADGGSSAVSAFNSALN